MKDAKRYHLREISRHFDIHGEFVRAYPHDEGYINDTFLGEYQTDQGLVRYVHQRINHQVFKNPTRDTDPHSIQRRAVVLPLTRRGYLADLYAY
jgi:hypothetical protein